MRESVDVICTCLYGYCVYMLLCVCLGACTNNVGGDVELDSNLSYEQIQ